MINSSLAPILALRDLTRIYPPRAGRPALEELAPIIIELAKGEFLADVGP